MQLNLATFTGWIVCEEESVDFDDVPSTPLAINALAVGVVVADNDDDEDPRTIIIMQGYHYEWYVVKGKYEDVLTILKQAAKRY